MTNNIIKYLRFAKDVVINPEEGNIEEKIIDRIEKVDEKDEKLLDEKYMDYFKKSNSRLYLFSEDVKNNPGRFTAFIVLMFVFLGVFIFVWSRLSTKKKEG